MADTNKRIGAFGAYYASCNNDTQRKANALYIYKYLSSYGWTLNAIAGLLGNIQAECGLSPGAKEKLGSGFGLIQWTPGSIHKDWCAAHGYTDATTMDANLAHIVDEAKNNTSWYSRDIYSESYSEFATSHKDPYYLACAFAWNRERPAIVIWGFHRGESTEVELPPRKNVVYNPKTKVYEADLAYCKKINYDPSCVKECDAYRYCYKARFGEANTLQQAERNRSILEKDKRGGFANEWYSYLFEVTFEPRLDDNDISVLKNKYWISRVSPGGKAKGGLNYSYAVEQWPADDDKNGIPNAMEGATQQDWDNLRGTYTTLPNCDSWAWGRAYEIMGQEPFVFSGDSVDSGDAGDWWDDFDRHKEELEAKGYFKSDKPALGAILCWQDPNNRSKMGHVAIVEAIHDNGNVSFSESGYKTWTFRPSYFNVQKNVDPKTAYSYKKYEFMGYIHLPGIRPKLPAVESFDLVSVETEKATFTLTISNNSTNSNLSNIFYVLNSDRPEPLSVTTGSNIITVNNLIPNTNYLIKILINAGGKSVESLEIPFTTVQAYPDPIKNIKIQSTGKNTETATFSVKVEKPDSLGYWHRIGNTSGYRVYTISDCKLLKYFDDELKSNTFSIKPGKDVKHSTNLQIGVSTWVTDNSGEKIFAPPGEKYPVCSNSIYLKDISEMSDTLFLVNGNSIHRVIPYIKMQTNDVFKPLNIFKLSK